jgi:hypothetical protein
MHCSTALAFWCGQGVVDRRVLATATATDRCDMIVLRFPSPSLLGLSGVGAHF